MPARASASCSPITTSRDALEITDRSYIIDGGRIIADGSREALLADPAARSAYLGEEFRM